MQLRPAAAAAVLLAALVAGVAGTPLLAIRLGKLPMPVVALPGDLTATGAGLGTPPDRGRVFAAVARTDEMLTGMLLGCALAAAAAAAVLTHSRDVSGLVLVAVSGVALLLRARMFVTVRHRLPLLTAGTCALATLALSAPPTPVLTTALAVLAAAVALTGARAALRPLSPYAGRAADILDILCLVSVVPSRLRRPGPVRPAHLTTALSARACRRRGRRPVPVADPTRPAVRARAAGLAREQHGAPPAGFPGCRPCRDRGDGPRAPSSHDRPPSRSSFGGATPPLATTTITTRSFARPCGVRVGLLLVR